MNQARQRLWLLSALLMVGCCVLLSSIKPGSAQDEPTSLVVLTQPQPSAIKELGTTAISPGGAADVVEITPQATNAGVFTVPGGQVFVITDVIIFPQSPGPGTLSVSLDQDNRAREFWVIPRDGPFQLHLSTGLVIGSGFSLRIRNGVGGASSIRVLITGYLS
jgi:hypothetical protein